jgi:hypothetical protein
MNDYYVWETRRRSDEALIQTFPATQKDYGVNFFVARRFLTDLPELEVLVEIPGRLTDDLVVAKQRCIAHSQRLREVLRRAGVQNIDYYPLRVVDPASGVVYRSHQAANILDTIHCLDLENSALEINDEDPTHIWYIDYLVLMGERLGDVPLFRLGDRPWTVIVRRDVKEAVEAAAISGPSFLPVDGYREYHGFAFNNPRNIIGTHDDDPDGPADGVRRNEPSDVAATGESEIAEA